MLRLEGERLGEIALEVGGALAGDAVDEIERDVVKSGIAKSVHGAPDVVRVRLPARASRAGAGAKLCAPSETRFAPPARSKAASSGVTVSGFASTVTSPAAGSAASSRASAAGLRERRRAAAEEDGLDVIGEPVALEGQLREQCIDVRARAGRAAPPR